MNKNLQTLETQIYNSIPRLRELSSGCEIYTPHWNTFKQQYDKDVFDRYYIFNDTVYNDSNESFCKAKDIELEFDLSNCRIGQPILLNDVLEWLMILDKKGIYAIDCSGLLFDSKARKIGNWNLSKPALKDQSQELIDALCELIPK